MASTLLQFLEHVYHAGAAKTSVAPNSWAVICWWRRFFKMDDDKAREQHEMVLDALEQVIQYNNNKHNLNNNNNNDNFEGEGLCPIATHYRKAERLAFLRQGNSASQQWMESPFHSHKNDDHNDHAPQQQLQVQWASHLDRAQQAQDARVLHHRASPDLSIPVLSSSASVLQRMHLAQ